MSNPSQTCEVCGARLPADTIGEPCPACLVRMAMGHPAEVGSPVPQGEPPFSAQAGNPPPTELDASPMGDAETEHTIQLTEPVEQGPGTRIGRYKLLEKVGEGGFGVVYVAEQREPVKRRVALKIIKLGMDTRQVVARFEAERQALALMDHPNIAKVLDGGATDTGR